MLFILRCVFWLTIVFWSMSWTSGATRQHPETLRDAVMAKGTTLADAAKAAVVAKLAGDIADVSDQRVKELLAKAISGKSLEGKSLEEKSAGGKSLGGKSVGVHGLDGATPGATPAWCVKSETECGQDAARMTALVAANLKEAAEEEATPDPDARATALPVPPLDPRRRVIVRELTRAP